MKLKKDNFETILSHRIPNVSSVEILCESHQFKIKGDFRISRGSKSVAQVFYFRYKYTLENGDIIIGQGESVPYARYGESFESVLGQIEAVRDQLEAPIILADLQSILPPGAARNAVDCALWDVISKSLDKSVWELLTDEKEMQSIESAITISLDSPEAMRQKALEFKDANLLKVKLKGDEDDFIRLDQLFEARPDARFILDPNESWSFEFLNQVSEKYADQPIVMVEQPIHTDEDAVLKHYKGTLPLGADESAHGMKGFERVHDLYDIINIKLDKTGGLTEAIKLLCLAKENNLKVMIGCMMCSSLGVAPAMILAQEAELVDLDAPLLIAEDREFSIQFDDYHALMPQRELWG